MESKNVTPISLSASDWLQWAFILLTTGGAIFQIHRFQSLYNEMDLDLIILGLAILLGLVLLVPILASKIPWWGYWLAALLFWVSQLVDWVEVPEMCVIFLTSIGIIIYPLILKWASNWKKDELNPGKIQWANPNLFALACGLMLGRLLINFELIGGQAIVITMAIIGFIFTLSSGIMAKADFTLTLKEPQLMPLRNQFQGLFFVMGTVILLESAMLPNMLFSAWLRVDIFLLFQLLIMGGTIAFHFFFKGDKILCPVMFAIFTVVFLVFQANVWATMISMLMFEMIMLNIVFLFPVLTAAASSPDDNRNPYMYLFFNYIAWFIGIIILLGGQFIFPNGNALLQTITLGMLAFLLLATWIKPRFFSAVKQPTKSESSKEAAK